MTDSWVTDMQGTEKRTNVTSLKTGDSLYFELSKLAEMDNRPIADYVHYICLIHVRGHGSKLSSITDRRK